MNSLPLFSITIPTYNRLPLLKQALASAQAQTYSNLEIILFDNHSDDGTYEYLEGCAQKDSRLHIIRNSENVGGVKNIQQIPNKVNGEYLLILADDDLIEPELCMRAVECMESSDNIVLYGAKTDHFFGDGLYETAKKIHRNVQNKIQIMSGKEQFKAFCKNRTFMSWSGIVYRVSILKKIGPLAYCYNIDLQSVVSCSLFGNFFLDNQILSHYRLSNISTSSTCWKGLRHRLEDCLIAYESIQRFSKDTLNKFFCNHVVFLLFCHIRSIKELQELREVFASLVKKGYCTSLYLTYVSAKHLPRLVLSLFFSDRHRTMIRRGYILCRSMLCLNKV